MIDKDFLKSIKLHDGNITGSNSHAHNAGWYNANGEKIGWGDLSTSDLKRLIKGMPEGDYMLTMFEGDSFWNFVKPETLNPVSGDHCETTPDENNPGLRYLADKAFMLIERGQVWRCQKYDTHKHGDEYDWHGITLKCMGREEMAQRIGAKLTVCPKCSSLDVECKKEYDRETNTSPMQLFCFECCHMESNPYV